jgi:hypothetical protein
MNAHDFPALKAEIDQILAQDTLDVDALDDAYTRITAACQPHEDAIAEITRRLETEEHSLFRENLLWADRRRHEATFAPLRVLRERIEEKAADIFAKAELDAALAETAARYSDQTRAEADKPKLLDGVRKLAGNIVHGLSANAAWQTRRAYEPVKNLVALLQKEKDDGKALNIAADIVETTKPKLFAKFASHTDIRNELLSAFIAELKK